MEKLEHLKEWLKHLFARRQGDFLLGDKRVPIKKLTWNDYNKFKKAIDLLPNGIVIVMSCYNTENFQNVLLRVFEECGDEIYSIVSSLSGVSEKYLKSNAGINEVIEYIYLIYKKNDLSAEIKKDLGSLLRKMFMKQSNQQNN